MKSSLSCVVVVVAASLGCGGEPERDPVHPAEARAEREAMHPHARPDSRPPPMHQPVPLWENGAHAREIDAANAGEEGFLVLDLADEWTPYLFTEQGNAEEPQVPNAYRATYLALARGEFPNDHHGERARNDKYLELFGILPTLTVLRGRFEATQALPCLAELDTAPLLAFQDFVVYESNDKARQRAQQFAVLRNRVEAMVRAQGVESEATLDEARLSEREKTRLRDYRALAPEVLAIEAAQARLDCEGYFAGKGTYIRGGLDWPTHEALAELERRHRVYGWGYIGRDTLAVLRESPVEAEREAVLRVLTERAMHALGVIEDGSRSEIAEGQPRTFRGRDGRDHPIPNLELDLRERIIAAFGLTTPETTLAWLKTLGDLAAERLVAIRAPELPEYYAEDMDLSIEIDRGDVWYEFPFDETGRERPQPVERRPRLTIFVQYEGQRIPLARFGTTIGGWRSEWVNNQLVWKYKNSPVGPVVWRQIVASPVWLPPESTPPRALLTRPARRRREEPPYIVNYHETGPSYASAYGLVAAYHTPYRRNADGGYVFIGDEGIRSHGSVDYMSIMRRHSHGCHRLHNHIAVRLMSFVLAHRHHRRVGQQPLAFIRDFEHEGVPYHMEIRRGGYIFDLERPVPVEVTEGRIRGSLADPIEHVLPKFNEDMGVYLTDGGAVSIDRNGIMTPRPMPVFDAGPLAPPVMTPPPTTVPAMPGAFPRPAMPYGPPPPPPRVAPP